jgi:hypothetical protein
MDNITQNSCKEIIVFLRTKRRWHSRHSRICGFSNTGYYTAKFGKSSSFKQLFRIFVVAIQ